MKIFYCILILAIFSTFSCTLEIENKKNAARNLIEKDKEFSEYSIHHGLRNAFFEYADSAAVLLKPEMMPLKGTRSIYNYYNRVNDRDLKLSWVPLDATIARSRDLGYTYGIWELSSPDSIMRGTYVTIWKKDKNGEWKYVLDSGNDSLGRSYIDAD